MPSVGRLLVINLSHSREEFETAAYIIQCDEGLGTYTVDDMYGVLLQRKALFDDRTSLRETFRKSVSDIGDLISQKLLGLCLDTLVSNNVPRDQKVRAPIPEGFTHAA